MLNTFHVQVPIARWPMDHLFHSSHLRYVPIQRLPSVSDHFPLYLISFTPSQKRIKKVLTDHEDQERAQETLNQNGGNSSDRQLKYVGRSTLSKKQNYRKLFRMYPIVFN
jgi:hypothetical protein